MEKTKTIQVDVDKMPGIQLCDEILLPWEDTLVPYIVDSISIDNKTKKKTITMERGI